MAEDLCPVWVGYLLSNPIRKILHNPQKILSPYVKNGMTVLDIGCAMGYFSIPLAHLVGSNGKVICVDVQEKMILVLEKRLKKLGLSDRVETRLSNNNSLNMDDFKEKIDFALAFAVVHEVSDVSQLFSEINKTMKTAGRLLVAEPKFHVSKNDFKNTVSLAEKNNFKVTERPHILLSHAVILEKDEKAL